MAEESKTTPKQTPEPAPEKADPAGESREAVLQAYRAYADDYRGLKVSISGTPPTPALIGAPLSTPAPLAAPAKPPAAKNGETAK